jgi:hypothetical protein
MASLLLAAGVPVIEVSLRLRHKQIETNPLVLRPLHPHHGGYVVRSI